MIHKNHALGPEGRRTTVPIAMGPEGQIADLEVGQGPEREAGPEGPDLLVGPEGPGREAGRLGRDLQVGPEGQEQKAGPEGQGHTVDDVLSPDPLMQGNGPKGRTAGTPSLENLAAILILVPQMTPMNHMIIMRILSMKMIRQIIRGTSVMMRGLDLTLINTKQLTN